MYTQYDITGDGKSDRIKITGTKNESVIYGAKKTVVYNYSNAYISVNGIKSKIQEDSISPAYKYTISIFNFSTGKPYLYVRFLDGNSGCSTTNALYQYKGSGKMKKILDIQSFFGKTGSYPDYYITNKRSDGFDLACSLMSYTLGMSKYRFSVNFKNGKLVINPTGMVTSSGRRDYQTNTTYKSFNALKKIKAYKSKNGSEVAFTIKKGGKVTVDKLYRNGKITRYRVKYQNKYGWINAAQKYLKDEDKILNCNYAG